MGVNKLKNRANHMMRLLDVYEWVIQQLNTFEDVRIKTSSLPGGNNATVLLL